MRIIDADKISAFGLTLAVSEATDNLLQGHAKGKGEVIRRAVDTFVHTLNQAPTVDQWHYPSKGELPEKDIECLVRTKLGNNFIAMIDSSDKCWCTGEFFSEYLEDDCVACWQYIIPPQEEV